MIGFLWFKVFYSIYFCQGCLEKAKVAWNRFVFFFLKNSVRDIQRCGVFRDSSIGKGFLPCGFSVDALYSSFYTRNIDF